MLESKIILPNTWFNQLLSILNGFITLPGQNLDQTLNLFHQPDKKVAMGDLFFSSVAYSFPWQSQSQLQLYWLSLFHTHNDHNHKCWPQMTLSQGPLTIYQRKKISRENTFCSVLPLLADPLQPHVNGGLAAPQVMFQDLSLFQTQP